MKTFITIIVWIIINEKKKKSEKIVNTLIL